MYSQLSIYYLQMAIYYLLYTAYRLLLTAHYFTYFTLLIKTYSLRLASLVFTADYATTITGQKSRLTAHDSRLTTCHSALITYLPHTIYQKYDDNIYIYHYRKKDYYHHDK